MTLRHLELLRFKPAASATDIAAIECALCTLRLPIDRVRGLERGTDVSLEGLSRAFTHRFFVEFQRCGGARRLPAAFGSPGVRRSVAAVA